MRRCGSEASSRPATTSCSWTGLAPLRCCQGPGHPKCSSVAIGRTRFHGCVAHTKRIHGIVNGQATASPDRSGKGSARIPGRKIKAMGLLPPACAAPSRAIPAIVSVKPDVRWDDAAGIDSAKVLNMFVNHSRFSEFRLSTYTSCDAMLTALIPRVFAVVFLAVRRSNRMALIGFGLSTDAFTVLMKEGPHLLAPNESDLLCHGSKGIVNPVFHYDLNFLTKIVAIFALAHGNHSAGKCDGSGWTSIYGTKFDDSTLIEDMHDLHELFYTLAARGWRLYGAAAHWMNKERRLKERKKKQRLAFLKTNSRFCFPFSFISLVVCKNWFGLYNENRGKTAFLKRKVSP